MKLKSESDIENLVKNNHEMMRILQIATELDLPDWWIGGGFLRNKVWDAQSGIEDSPATDVDLVYFDKTNIEPEIDWQYDEKLRALMPDVKWEVRNQARMHYINGLEPFSSSEDSMSHWPETATAIGVKLTNGKIVLNYCYGADDLLGLIARPTPYFSDDKISVFHYRITNKQWLKRWPKLVVKEK